MEMIEKRLAAGENPVRVYRQAAGLKMRELADKAGVSESHLNKVELNLVQPTVTFLQKLGDVLEVAAGELIRREK